MFIIKVKNPKGDKLMFQIFLVRQGQTDWNLNKKFNGCTNTELNHTGFEQAEFQAENLKNIYFKIQHDPFMAKEVNLSLK